ncbi:hypothetical protein BH11MYX2_BH11MYX2_08590 [soil metagenome]
MNIRGRIVHDAPFHDEGYGFDLFGLHPPLLASAAVASRRFYERYFRVRSHSIHHIPSGPVILIANHAGVLPIDAMLLCLDVLYRSDPPRIPRPVLDHFVPRLPMVSTLFARLGAVCGTPGNARRLLDRGELLVIFPEGVSGPAKHTRDRYRLQDWSVGFAELAIRHGASIVPVAVIGGEESWPLAVKLGIHPFGSPYIPIPWSPLPLPVRYELTYGAPLTVAADPREANDPSVVATLAEDARAALAQLLVDSRMVRRSL